MHAGNLLCAVLAYASVKSKGGKFLVRIEDVDAERCPRSAATAITETLAALGIKSDGPVIYQSERNGAYAAALKKISDRARIYPCFCSRAELHADGIERLPDGGILYPRTCARLTKEQAELRAAAASPALRLTVPDESVEFTDGIMGAQKQNLARECGDFIIRRSDGVYAYQLAVTVDDGECGVTEVVRGADLLYDTPRQIYLQRLLDFPEPKYYHIPLAVKSDGSKLSKSAGDSAERLLKRIRVNTLLGALGYAAGLLDENRDATLDELVALYSPDKIPRECIRLPSISE